MTLHHPLTTNPLTQDELDYRFLQACREGDLARVRYLLLSPELPLHADIHVRTSWALSAACSQGHWAVAAYLLTSPELPRHCDIHAHEDEALRHACHNGQLEVVKNLLSSPELRVHADINSQGPNGGCPLTNACENGHLEVVRYLLSSPELSLHAHWNERHDDCLITAFCNGHTPVVKYLLRNADSSLDSTDPPTHAERVLVKALERHHLELIHFLLYDMHVPVRPQACHLLNAEARQELSHMVQKRDTYMRLQRNLDSTPNARMSFISKKI